MSLEPELVQFAKTMTFGASQKITDLLYYTFSGESSLSYSTLYKVIRMIL